MTGRGAINLYLGKELVQEIDELAKDLGLTRSSMVRMLLIKSIKQNKKEI